ncbi:hypothetical protein ACFZB4_18355 [Streptomyces pseudovenezuelae]|uniref:hypothetical protein n=1 Tax=Streptomyces pseudovenezuelae TaxID=67350 RepID=UPI0036E24282
MTTDDFVFRTLIANHPDPATASRALAMAEAAVLRRAADALNALPQDFECDPGWGDAAERLRRTADGIEEKASASAPTATPREAARERRLEQTLDTIRTHGGKWTSSTLQTVRRATGAPAQRGTARRDLAELARRGHLAQHGAGDGRYYTLRRRKDGA